MECFTPSTLGIRRECGSDPIPGTTFIDALELFQNDDQTEAINQFFIQNQTAKELVAKWFNRDVDGNFDMEVIANRGSYNASDLDVLVAQDSQRGQALLEDAGEELIKNTFVIVYDFKYTNKEEKAKKTGGFLSVVSAAASFVPGMENVSTVVDGVNLAQTALGKGYFVKTTAYLYQLEWNEEVASRFYNEMWMDENSHDPNRKAAFDNTDIFKLKFIGTQIARKNLQSTIFSNNCCVFFIISSNHTTFTCRDMLFSFKTPTCHISKSTY